MHISDDLFHIYFIRFLLFLVQYYQAVLLKAAQEAAEAEQLR